MKRSVSILSIAMIALMVAACGYRTDPVPYDSVEPSLPRVNGYKPVYQGDQLLIKWSLDSSLLDATADTFFIHVFDHGSLSCLDCSSQPFETLAVSIKESTSITTKTGDSYSQALLFPSETGTHGLLIPKPMVDAWNKRGLYYFTITYQTEARIHSDHSQRLYPTWSGPVEKPEISVSVYKSSDGLGRELVITWKRITETVFRPIDQQQVGNEKTLYFGLNIFEEKITDQGNAFIKLNDKPLLSGKLLLSTAAKKLYGSHIDRFGNESQKVLFYDYTQD